MARGRNIGYKRKTSRKSREKIKDSDESDEDYDVDEDEEFNGSDDDQVDEDEEFDGSEDDCSFAEDESEESLGLSTEEEELVEKKLKKVKKPRVKKRSQARQRSGVVMARKKKVVYSEEDDDDDDGTSGDEFGIKPRKRTKVSYKEDEDDDTEVLYRQDEDEFVDQKPRKKSRTPSKKLNGNSRNGNSKKKRKVSGEEDDEEFTPNEVLKKTRKRPVKNQTVRGKNRSNCFRDEKAALAPRKKKTVKGWGRRKKVVVNSDSDFVCSGASDYEYTVSEEEREQIREATKFCGRLSTNFRSSRSSKMIKEEEKTLPSKGKRLARKGKQKLVELKAAVEVGIKQVCGICLSEEGKRTVKGVLNCCSHYFCFACIMAWSKVESRCPLCKQRFATISKTTRAEGGHHLLGAVFPVPERDQVYQPSEEELRGYLDPYENVLCTECLQGGDDALMLLCDLCDSPAHTYCVGLGHEVPDGNWYCDGCRPTVVASTNAQAMNHVPDNGANNNISIGSSPVTSVREIFDLNEAYVPDTPMSQGSGHSHSPFGGHIQANSPVSGSGAFTLLERRRIQRQIHQLLNNRIRQPERSDMVAPSQAAASRINLFGSPIGQDWAMATQNTVVPSRTVLQSMYPRTRLPDYNMPPSREVASPRLRSLRGEDIGNQASTSSNQTSVGLLSGLPGMNSRIGGGLGHPQLHPCGGTSNNGVDVNTTPYQYREEFITMGNQATLEVNPFQRPAHQRT